MTECFTMVGGTWNGRRVPKNEFPLLAEGEQVSVDRDGDGVFETYRRVGETLEMFTIPKPPVEVTLSDKFWTWSEQFPTMHCVLRERGITKALLVANPGAPRFVLVFPGVGCGEAPDFDSPADFADACKVIDGAPGDLDLKPVTA